MAALYHVVKNLQNANRAARLQHESLKLGALVIYQINALIYRPAEGHAENILLEASCQHVPMDSMNGPRTHPIMYGRGAYFLSDVVDDDGAYRLPNGRPIDASILLALYRRDFMEDVEVEFSDSRISNRSKYPKVGYPSRKRKTTYRICDGEGSSGSSEDSQVEGDDEELELELEVVQRNIRRAATDTRSRETTDSILSSELPAIQHQFASDIFQLAPSPKLASISHWVLLNPAQRLRAKVEIFHSLDLSGIFCQVQYRVINDADWDNLVFQRYFPAKGASTAKALQQFPSASYYRQWQALMDGLDEDRAEIIQNRLRQWFNNLYWVPHPGSDRMWTTKKGGKEWTMLPPGEPGNCPRIAVNPRFIGKDTDIVLATGTS